MTGIFSPVFLGVVFIMGCWWLEYYGLSERGREEECLHDNGVAKGLGLKGKGVCAVEVYVYECVCVCV